MARYVALIDGEDGAYGAVFPDAPGCHAMGETVEKTLLNARVALGEWIAHESSENGLGIPKVRTIDELLKDREFVDQMKDNPIIAYVPAIVESRKFARANLSIDTALLESIDKEAEAVGMTRSSFLISAALDKLRSNY